MNKMLALSFKYLKLLSLTQNIKRATCIQCWVSFGHEAVASHCRFDLQTADVCSLLLYLYRVDLSVDSFQVMVGTGWL